MRRTAVKRGEFSNQWVDRLLDAHQCPSYSQEEDAHGLAEVSSERARDGIVTH
jgi:hypothetical protein